MNELGAAIARQLRAGDLVALDGELGAGKTTFTRGLGEELQVRGAVTSPTFVLARTHPRPDGPPLVHVDAYRLGSPAELDDLDIDFAGSIVVVEWAAGMLDGITEDWLGLQITRPRGSRNAEASTDEGVEPRTVEITPHGERWAEFALPGFKLS
ncbi:tRNA (adenosine(37)-N6)-threonylcarbamoyltransferase complex ATPase subunit type 1 TsaE [Lacisediminihabitans sp. G11-30]|uniref:tRNA threonylcarbamoyladenosine biosynthesis protein TsaE n=2 Tax=Lacisediminihabitans changchengi TaxID=2787634 RepID=A0A934SMY8_9MICO|nr:tRNA (adenosine(37)-N6)-threonylcarbamoyltransferase complex ATPase subunit type 1 TsaE [Lacisediminihabitans changchengi]